MKLTQKNFDALVNNFNHKMSHIENDLKWVKRMGYYMATCITAIAIKSML